ncbi:TspO/MBR family protein [Aquibium oceanicum]|uniref:Sensor histidine kinase n=1 Tax=Aquibium oceanicum TaxID=1670800 RepID=A0A1L3SVH4_9HYPH|nr:TspO/MBR family protein [Aquibium oceanicum]APH73351.1 sensor histidine kinase [Aquibium oceanicum]
MQNTRTTALIFFLALVLAGGLTIGYLNTPGEWYAGLAKPPFNPPSWLFGPAWTVLYVLIGIAGARIWSRVPRSSAMAAWWTQLALNFLWSPVFFTMHAVGMAFIVILGMLAAIVFFIVLAWRVDRVSAFLFLPYLCWVSFAGLLNGSILWLN